jgi:hypothetical protein
MKNSPTVSLFRGAALIAAMALSVLGTGCASEGPHPQLMLTSVGHDRTFAQQFSHAFVSRDPDGTTDLVLVDRAAEGALIGMNGSAPVRQIMHLRVLWNPKRDQKAEHASGSNATVHWYVMGNTPQSSCDILEYSGTAFVLVNDSEDGTDLTIRNATIKLVACRGDLQDPVGSCTLAGTIHATENRGRVREVLNCVCTVVSANDNLPRNLSSTAKPERPSSLAR